MNLNVKLRISSQRKESKALSLMCLKSCLRELWADGGDWGSSSLMGNHWRTWVLAERCNKMQFFPNGKGGGTAHVPEELLARTQLWAGSWPASPALCLTCTHKCEYSDAWVLLSALQAQINTNKQISMFSGRAKLCCALLETEWCLCSRVDWWLLSVTGEI